MCADGLDVDVSERESRLIRKLFGLSSWKHGAVPNELGEAKELLVGAARLGSRS